MDKINSRKLSNRESDKIKQSLDNRFPEIDVKVVGKFNEDMVNEFSISVKSKDAGLYNMLRMFAAYFASLEYYEDKNPGIDKYRKEDLEPIAIAIAKEIGRHDLDNEDDGIEMFKEWVKSLFLSLKSGHGV